MSLQYELRPFIGRSTRTLVISYIYIGFLATCLRRVILGHSPNQLESNVFASLSSVRALTVPAFMLQNLNVCHTWMRIYTYLFESARVLKHNNNNDRGENAVVVRPPRVRFYVCLWRSNKVRLLRRDMAKATYVTLDGRALVEAELITWHPVVRFADLGPVDRAARAAPTGSTRGSKISRTIFATTRSAFRSSTHIIFTNIYIVDLHTYILYDYTPNIYTQHARDYCSLRAPIVCKCSTMRQVCSPCSPILTIFTSRRLARCVGFIRKMRPHFLRNGTFFTCRVPCLSFWRDPEPRTTIMVPGGQHTST